jgi:uncharacterized protein (DUF2342 family)
VQISEIPETEIAIFFALREAAISRLFESNPWLVSYMNAAIAEYGKGIHIDLDANPTSSRRDNAQYARCRARI